jgi:hypothetical protein
MEDLRILARDLQQRIHRLIGDIVRQVADGHGAGELAQTDVLVVPVARACLVHLPEDRTVVTVHAIQFLVGFGAQVCIPALHVGHQLPACEFLRLAVHFELEHVAVRDGIVQGFQRAHTGHVLDVDDLLLRLAQRVWLEVAHRLEVIAVIARFRHQAFGVGLVQFLPPQAEEQRAVLHLRRELLHARHVGLRGLVLRIGRERQDP